MAGRFPVGLFPVSLTFPMFQAVSVTTRSTKPNSASKGASWVVVGGRWLVAVPSCTGVEWQQQLTSGKTSPMLRVSLLERQVTKKVHMCPMVTLSTQSGYAKVGTSFCLSYMYYIYIHMCVSYISCICKRYISSTYIKKNIYVTCHMPCRVLTTLDIRYVFFTTTLSYNTNILIIPFHIGGK